MNGLVKTAIIICSLSLMSIAVVEAMKLKENKTPAPVVIRVERYQSLTEWETFMLALAEVESENNSKAKGNGDYIGLLQIAPVYVKEANNIKGEKYFKLNDRYNAKKSIEMFLTINNHRNQEQDIDKAIKLHNPTASVFYKNKILKKIEEINKRETIRLHCVTAMKEK